MRSKIDTKASEPIRAGQFVVWNAETNSVDLWRPPRREKDSILGTAMEDIPEGSEIEFDLSTGRVRLKGQEENASHQNP